MLQLKPGTQIKDIENNKTFTIVSIDVEIAGIPKSQNAIVVTLQLDNGRFYDAFVAQKQLVDGEIEIINTNHE